MNNNIMASSGSCNAESVKKDKKILCEIIQDQLEHLDSHHKKPTSYIDHTPDRRPNEVSLLKCYLVLLRSYNLKKAFATMYKINGSVANEFYLDLVSVIKHMSSTRKSGYPEETAWKYILAGCSCYEADSYTVWYIFLYSMRQYGVRDQVACLLSQEGDTELARSFRWYFQTEKWCDHAKYLQKEKTI